MSANNIIATVDIEGLSDLLLAAGYRVTRSEQGEPGEEGKSVQLLSASQGIGFALRPGNRAAENQYLDFTLSCALRVQGTLPDALINDWNTAKRFARLTLQSEFLVLEQDVIVAGGVTQAHLRASCEIWDRLLQEFLLFLRQYANEQPALATGGGRDEAAEPAAQAAS